jgi:hypothetical protein
MNFYSNNRGARGFSIVFPPILQYLFSFIYMIQGKARDTHFLCLLYHFLPCKDMEVNYLCAILQPIKLWCTYFMIASRKDKVGIGRLP